MSYDFQMCADVGASSLVPLRDYDDLNYTYNVEPMFRKALPPDGILTIHNLTGRAALPHLKTALDAMIQDPATYKALNPSNGWGDYYGAMNVLKILKQWCEEVPDATLLIT